MADTLRQNVFADPLDDLLRGFFVRPMSLGSAAAQFRMDVRETEIAYRVRADLPGVKKDDIVVTVDDNTVTISAEVRGDDGGGNGDRLLRSERYVGKLSRTFSLAEDIEASGAEARYVDGVLELVLPKKAAATRKRLVVS